RLVVAQPAATRVDDLVARPIGRPARDLTALRSAGIRLGAVTNVQVMGEADVRALLATIGVDELLEVVVTSTAVGAEKPDPRGVLHALESLGVGPSEALFVGDEDADAGAAAAAGVAFARVDAATTAADAVRAALTESDGAFAAAAALVGPLDKVAGVAAGEHHDRLTKPRGALGRVETLGVQLAAIAGEEPPPIPAPAAVAVFAGDHGVVARGVTPWPQEVTAQMVGNFVAGGAAINVLARQVGARVTVVDVGVATELDGLGIAALAGFVVGAASHRVPVVVDGVIALASLLVACEVCPRAVDYAIAGHRSTEPGAAVALAHLGLEPVLDLGLRLGEGS